MNKTNSNSNNKKDALFLMAFNYKTVGYSFLTAGCTLNRNCTISQKYSFDILFNISNTCRMVCGNPVSVLHTTI